MPGRIWFLIAAAGASSRFGGSVPKPYLRIGGRSLLEHALRALARVPGIQGGVVVTTASDRRYRRLPAAVRRNVTTAVGGASRTASVLAGLRALKYAATDDWVLVHDAARPCLARGDLDSLITECRRDPVGGLLAMPVTDTVKQSDADGRCIRTLPRERLWRAQTPQMFRYGLLSRALARAVAEGFDATDEAAAIESLGFRPRLVEGSPLNLKITQPADLVLARAAMQFARRAS